MGEQCGNFSDFFTALYQVVYIAIARCASFLTCRLRGGHANNTTLTGEHGSDMPLSPDFLFTGYRRVCAAVLDKHGVKS